MKVRINQALSHADKAINLATAIVKAVRIVMSAID